MNRILILITGILLMVTSLSINANTFEKDYQKMSILNIGEPLDKYSMIDLTGKQTQLFHQKKVTLVSVFTTWCSVCKLELKQLETDYQRINKENLPIDILIVNAGESIRKVKKYKHRYGLSMPMLIDKKLHFIKDLHIMGTPTVLIFDQNNSLIYQGSELPAEWIDQLVGQ
jgi:peroxiredoxin